MMRRPVKVPDVETEESFVGSHTNQSPTSDVTLFEEIAGHFTESGSTILRDDNTPPHFSIPSTQTPTIKRRTPATMAAMFKRRIMRARKQAAESLATQSATDSGSQMDIATGATSAPIDSEFGTGFLRVESRAGSEDEGCVEQAEAVLAMSGLTPDETHQALRTNTTMSSDTTASGRTMTAGSAFERLVTRARRVLRPLADVPVGGRNAPNNRVGNIIEPPPGVVFKELKIDGELRVVLTRDPSPHEVREDFETMKQRFPGVPKFEGNPPWLTKFHPDLVRPPTHPQMHA